MSFNPNPLQTTAQFIEQANKVHNYKYDYSLTNYTGSSKKVTIICPIHGEFSQEASSHKRGCGCPKCRNLLSKTINTKPQSIFIEQANRQHNNKYDYSKTIYTAANNKVIITCPDHGDFEQIANDHKRGHGCPICAGLLRAFTKTFYKNKHTIFYVLHLHDTNTYKIGITCTSIPNRYKQEKHVNYSVILEQHFFNGEDAWVLEKLVLRDLRIYKYKGLPIFNNTGVTEIVTINPLNTILQRITNGQPN